MFLQNVMKIFMQAEKCSNKWLIFLTIQIEGQIVQMFRGLETLNIFVNIFIQKDIICSQYDKSHVYGQFMLQVFTC